MRVWIALLRAGGFEGDGAVTALEGFFPCLEGGVGGGLALAGGEGAVLVGREEDGLGGGVLTAGD